MSQYRIHIESKDHQIYGDFPIGWDDASGVSLEITDLKKPGQVIATLSLGVDPCILALVQPRPTYHGIQPDSSESGDYTLSISRKDDKSSARVTFSGEHIQVIARVLEKDAVNKAMAEMFSVAAS